MLGWPWPYETIHHIAEAVGQGNGAIEWIVTAALDGVIGLVLGFILIPVVTKIIAPVFSVFFPEKQKPAH